ncbi:GDSL-type esterase/lipase family protein [Actinoplanes sp. NPDC049596]|uniref:GDSL-type esterase/lipase family protein n=1 Tax=unclassified Actinoplanes TaxID=2626549 RepID=UPI00342B9417
MPRNRGIIVATAVTGAVAAAVAATSLLPASAGTRPAVASDAWTGTWAAAPQAGGASFQRQTLRQIVHTSISGSAARVELSNAFGSAPVTVSDLHLARRTSGSSVDSSTDRAVTFGGSASVTIPAGSKVVSDSVSFTVAALTDVSVSFYLPGQVSNATGHQLAEQTNYVASGDQAGSASLSNSQTNGNYTLLAGLDVQNPAASGAVVTLGASITDGIASAGDQNRRWPNDLAVRLDHSGRTVGVLNEGISGNALLRDGAGQSAVNRFDRDVLQQTNAKWVIFADDPINDVNVADPPSGAQLTAALTQMINSAHAHGITFICATLTPFKPDAGWSQAGEDSREAYDSFVRSPGSGCDAVLDVDAATHDPASPQQYLPAYDAGDHLHPNTDGLQAIADAVDLRVFGSAIAPSASPTPEPDAVVALRARVNDKYVTAEDAGAQALIANRDAVGDWESFDRIPMGDGTFALRAHSNGEYVTASPDSPLIASGRTVSDAQRFRLVANGDGSSSLLAVVDGDYVTAENAGADPLIANRTAVGPWEEFDVSMVTS